MNKLTKTKIHGSYAHTYVVGRKELEQALDDLSQNGTQRLTRPSAVSSLIRTILAHMDDMEGSGNGDTSSNTIDLEEVFVKAALHDARIAASRRGGQKAGRRMSAEERHARAAKAAAARVAKYGRKTAEERRAYQREWYRNKRKTDPRT